MPTSPRPKAKPSRRSRRAFLVLMVAAFLPLLAGVLLAFAQKREAVVEAQGYVFLR